MLSSFLPNSNNKMSNYNYFYRLLTMSNKEGLDLYLSSTTDIFEDNIYITTSNNIIKGNYINDNLKSSDNWEIISLPTDLPLVFHIFGSNYYVGGYNEFWKYNGTNWQTINLEIDTNFGNDYTVLDIIEVDDVEQYTLGGSKYIVGHKLKVQADINYSKKAGIEDFISFRTGFEFHF